MRSKLEVEKNLLDQPTQGAAVSNQATAEFFFTSRPQIFLQHLGLQEFRVPCLKDLIHICSEKKAQGRGMTFNLNCVDSNHLYFISYRGLC